MPGWEDNERRVALLAHLPIGLRSATRLRRLAAGAMLFRQGQPPRAMHVVLDGEIRLLRSTRYGADIILQRTTSGFVAEASLDQSAYHCDARAALNSNVLVIPIPAFRAALDDIGFRTAWIRELARELRRLRAVAERLSLKTSRERIRHFLETEGVNGALTLAQTRKAWAAELGITHEALYRELARMRRFGEIRAAGPTICLIRPHAPR
jgi:CRP-like cAMP-binding protein